MHSWYGRQRFRQLGVEHRLHVLQLVDKLADVRDDLKLLVT